MIHEYSAGAFIYRKTGSGMLLLVLRRKGSAYDLPKGHIEKGESAEEAAVREIKEETGIDAELMPYFSVTNSYFFTRKKERVAKKVKFFISKTRTGKVTISKEHKGYVWCDIKNAGKLLKYKDLLEILPEVTDYINRIEAIAELNAEYANLPRKESTWQLSRNFVPGAGPLNARLMLIGQAPGAMEDTARRPFVGRSGMLLDRFLKDAGMKRNCIYITSTVQFFPFKNREPTNHEISLCNTFLRKQISIIRPKYILILGRIAAKTILGISGINSVHGRFIERNGIKYMITLHPSAVLRFPKNSAAFAKDLAALAQELKKD